MVGDLGRGIHFLPCFFVLVMECFSALVTIAEARGLFLPLGMSVIKHRIFLYADDVVVFVLPVEMDLILIRPFWTNSSRPQAG